MQFLRIGTQVFFQLFALVLCYPSIARAAKATVLPEGALLSYQGAICGQIEYDWAAGTVNKKLAFTPLSATIGALQKSLRRASGAKAAKLKKQLKQAQKTLATQGPLCAQLATNIVAPSSAQAAEAGATTISWAYDLGTLKTDSIGQTYKFFCPANGESDNVWGSDTYTADSSICNAAVHAGVIRRQFGGNVNLVMKTGLDRYVGGIRNGVSALLYTSYSVAYSFVNPATGVQVASGAPVVLPSQGRITTFRSAQGTAFTFLCPANLQAGSLWGTGIYTDDSVVCTAAVHAGKISKNLGGQITLTLLPGQTSYTGSSANGVTSNSYGSYSGSFGF